MGMPWSRTPATSPKPEPEPEPEPELTRVIDVFTPSVPAARGFVGRSVEMNDLKKLGLRVPGTQVVVWGESGAGKSSLVNKVLEDVDRTAVQTSCIPGSTYEQILESAFAGTGAFYITETTSHTDASLAVSSTIGSELVGAKVKGEATYETGEGATRQPIARPQLSPQRLLAELGKRNLSWVIEDFHKVDKAGRDAIAHALKVFSDNGRKYPKTTVIVLGVSGSLSELVAPETNNGYRLIDIEVKPLSPSHLGEILTRGEDLLNVNFSSIRNDLLDNAVGTASIAHALALACCNEREIEETAASTVAFTAQDFGAAQDAYTRTHQNTVLSRFEKALLTKRKRKFDNTELIMRALADMPEEGASGSELFAHIKAKHPSYRRGNLTSYLDVLQTEERGALIRRTATNLFRFDEPLQHAFAKAYFIKKDKAAAEAASTATATNTTQLPPEPVEDSPESADQSDTLRRYMQLLLSAGGVVGLMEEVAALRADDSEVGELDEETWAADDGSDHDLFDMNPWDSDTDDGAQAEAEARAEAEERAEAEAEARAEAQAEARADADYDLEERDNH